MGFDCRYDLKLGTLKNSLQAIQPTMFIVSTFGQNGAPNCPEKVYFDEIACVSRVSHASGRRSARP